MTDDEFDEQPTPERALSRLTDSERDVMRNRLAVVSEFEDREITEPVDVFRRPPRPTENELVRMLRRDPGQLAEFVAKIAVRLHERERGDSDANRKALAEVRALLDRPPDGRVKELQADVERLNGAIATLERSALTAGADGRVRDLAEDVRIKALEGDAKFAKHIAQSVLIFLLLSIGAAGLWLGSKVEKLDNVIETVKQLEHPQHRWPQAAKDPSP